MTTHELTRKVAADADIAGGQATSAVDAALVGLGESSQHALELIDTIVREATCPVIGPWGTMERKVPVRPARLSWAGAGRVLVGCRGGDVLPLQW
jgi:hypothetical protein